MTSSTAPVVAQFPCPKWCGLPVDHEFLPAGDDVAVRHHVRDLFTGGEAGFLVFRAVEVRIGGTESAHGVVRVFADGVEKVEGDVHDLALWLLDYTTARDLKPRHLEVVR
jgi:hypothetical protein